MTRALMILAAAALLSACGLKDDLEPAPPLWGDKTRSADETVPRPSDNEPKTEPLVFPDKALEEAAAAEAEKAKKKADAEKDKVKAEAPTPQEPSGE